MEKDKQDYYILAGSYAKSEQEGIQLLIRTHLIFLCLI